MKLLLLLTVKSFLDLYYPTAKQIEQECGIRAEITLTHAAIETGWGKSIRNNNLFGIKGNGDLVKTTEYHNTICVYYPEIFSITKIGDRYKYVVMDYFRCYDNPYASFRDYVTLIECYYPVAWKNRTTPTKYFKGLRGKYATHPSAYTLQLKVLKIVTNELKLYKSSEVCP